MNAVRQLTRTDAPAVGGVRSRRPLMSSPSRAAAMLIGYNLRLFSCPGREASRMPLPARERGEDDGDLSSLARDGGRTNAIRSALFGMRRALFARNSLAG